MWLGLRGVGKTVLLNRVHELATEEHYLPVVIEAPEDRTLPQMLVPHLRSVLFKLSHLEQTRDLARRALAVLRAFAGAFKITSGGVDFGVQAATGTADSGALEFAARGYPYFLQEWGYHTWQSSPASRITARDTAQAGTAVLRQPDEGFFRVRLDRLTPRERDYMRAMAILGPGPHRSGEIAKQLQLAVTAAAPLRNNLIRKGMLYSPPHGDTAFTVPMFDAYLRPTLLF